MLIGRLNADYHISNIAPIAAYFFSLRDWCIGWYTAASLSFAVYH